MIKFINHKDINIIMSEEKLKYYDKQLEELLLILPNDYDKELIKKAYNVSKTAHSKQLRQSGEPYISHPLEVAKIVASYGLDDISIASALLHDTLEDTPLSLASLKKDFGEEVAQIVEGLTKIEGFGNNRYEKNIEALRKILLSSAKDIRILIIKLCDRLHNMRTLEEVPEEKRERVSRETLLIYAPIAQKIGIYSLKWELEDLSLKYKNPEMYKYIKDRLGMKREDREEIVKKVVEEIKEVFRENKLNDIIVIGRPKNFYSIYKKIKNKAKSFEDIHDLYAVRVITKDVSQAYHALGLIHENFPILPDKLKDYIANPKNNGYQSLHTVILSKKIKAPIEVQIRDEDMNKLAEFGVAAHWKYKNLREDKKFEKKIAWLREILQWEKEHKDSHDFLELLKFDFFEDEIFIFTPKGDIITLPENSTVLDFAYNIHSEIGNHAQKAKINGEITTIDKVLKNGDLVEIITNSKVSPSEKWLKIVISSKAKLAIRSALNLKLKPTRKGEQEDIPFEKLKTMMHRVDEYKKVRCAGCCKFVYLDQVIGIESKDKKELILHNASCDNAKYSINKKIPISWKTNKFKEVTLTLLLKDRFGILMEVLNIFAEFNLNVSKLNTKILKDGSVTMSIKIADGPFIEKLVKKLKKLDSIQHVKETRSLFF